MTKVTGPLLSISASGSIGERLTFSQRKSGQQVRFQKAQKDVITADRITARFIYSRACTVWILLNSREKKVYTDRAVGQPYTGFNLFVKEFILYSSIDPSCVACYLPIIGTGETLLDVSGNDNNGLLKPSYPANSPQWVTGKNEKMPNALSFDGVDDFVEADSDFIGVGAKSFCAWIKPSGWGSGGFGRVFDNVKSRIYLDVYNNSFKLQSNGISIVRSADNSIILDQWQHICATRDASGTANLYVNGVLSGDADQNSGTPESGSTNVFIGNNSIKNRAFYGLIGYLAFYSRVLTVGEVFNHYNLTK